MHRCSGRRVVTDELVLLIDVGVVLIAIKRLLIFLGPFGIHVFLSNLVRLRLPIFRHVSALDILIFFARVALTRHVYDRRVDNLPALGVQTFLPQRHIRSQRTDAAPIPVL